MPARRWRISNIFNAPFPGRYEAILAVARASADGTPAGQITIRGGGRVLATNRIEFTSQRLGPVQISRGPFRIFNFEVPANLPRGVSGIQIRIESTGTGPFRIRNIAVKPKTAARELRDKAYTAASGPSKEFRQLWGTLRDDYGPRRLTGRERHLQLFQPNPVKAIGRRASTIRIQR